MNLPRTAALFALAAVAPLFFSAGGDVMNNMVLAAAYVVMALGTQRSRAASSSPPSCPAGDVRDQAKQDCRDSAD